MRPMKNYLVIPLLLFFNFLMGQNYQAVHGSSYAGSLSVENNPASIVDASFAWDITPFAVQVKQSTNAFTIKKYSLLSSYKKAEIALQDGIKKRFFYANQDIHLFNSRIRLNSKAAIAFGANVRSYIYLLNSKANWQDSAIGLADFAKINTSYLPLSADGAASAWAEVYGTYAQTIVDDGQRILNIGLTLKINRALAGGYATAQDINYIPSNVVNGSSYIFTHGNLQYGYSSNFDKINDNNSAAANRKTFLQNQHSSLSADIGFEYSLQPLPNLEGEDENIYNTKIGVALLDVGSNRYQYGSRSRAVIENNEGVTDSILENKFENVSTPDEFNDSLASITNTIATPGGSFTIYEPTRLVINIDKHLSQNFFINTEVTLPLISLASKNTLFIKDMNLLAVTPRWETKTLGFYIPVLLNIRRQLWVGGAVKAGPVLFGLHNISNLFLKNKIQNGGFYLAFTVRPGKKHDSDAYSRNKLTRKERRNLECPTL
jgi:hypothetical protein